MTRIIVAFFLTCLLSLNLSSQEVQLINESSYDKNNSYKYQLGSGLVFNFDDSTHVFKIGGMVQSRYLNENFKDSLTEAFNYFGIKRFQKDIQCNNDFFTHSQINIYNETKGSPLSTDLRTIYSKRLFHVHC